jgi:hypothetical protein
MEHEGFHEARPLGEWHEDVGPVMWWRFPIEEAPFCGTPTGSDWPGYHTHWTPIPLPKRPWPEPVDLKPPRRGERKVSEYKSCLNCGLAKWDKTAAGHLHPSGHGRCQWAMPVIPISSARYYIGGPTRDVIPGPTGGGIDRKAPHTNCPTWVALT